MINPLVAVDVPNHSNKKPRSTQYSGIIDIGRLEKVSGVGCQQTPNPETRNLKPEH